MRIQPLAAALAALCSSLGSAAHAQDTYHRGSGYESEAQRIGLEMLNDAASGRFRSQAYHRAPNPFDALIERYEADQRQRAADFAAAYERARYEAIEREAIERDRAEYEARMRTVEEIGDRYDAFTARSLAGDARSALEAAWMLLRGELDGRDFSFGVSREEVIALQLQAAVSLGLDLALIVQHSYEAREAPSLMWVRDRVFECRDKNEERDKLCEFAEDGHLGALMWLGGWYAGRDVELGAPPAPLPGCVDARASALWCLERAHRRQGRAGGTWYAAALLSPGGTDAERTLGRSILEELVNHPQGAVVPAQVVLALDLVQRSQSPEDHQRARALLEAAVERDWLPASEARAEIELQGLHGVFDPSSAALALRPIEELPEQRALFARRQLARGFAALYGVDESVDPMRAAEAFQRAVVEGSGGSKVEAAYWLASVLVEHDWEAKDFGDGQDVLRDGRAGDVFLPQLLAARAAVMRRGVERDEARAAWAELDGYDVCALAERPAEVLAALECLQRLAELGVKDDLGPLAAEVEALDPRRAPVLGAALLARATFTSFSPRDATQRFGLERTLATLARHAQQDVRAWPGAVALIEVLQVEPIPREVWAEGWVRIIRGSDSDGSVSLGAESDALRADLERALVTPDTQSLARLAELEERVPADEQTSVRALHASLTLRSTRDVATASGALVTLRELAGAGSWHALALLDTFDARYRLAYARRGDHEGFRVDARSVYEELARWRSEGHAFTPAGGGARWRALASALMAGSDGLPGSGLDRAALRAAADAGDLDAALAAARLAAHEADPRTQEERDDDATAEVLLVDVLDVRRWLPDEYPLPWRPYIVVERLSEERGVDVARPFAMRLAERCPRLHWDLAHSIHEGYFWEELGARGALEHCRRALAHADSGMTPKDVAHLVRFVAEAGDAEDRVRLNRCLADPAVPFERVHTVLGDRRADEVLAEVGRAALADSATAGGEAAAGNAVQDEARARARRLLLVALRAGSTDAMHLLEAEPALVPPLELARALVRISSVNAPLAVPRLRAALAAGEVAAADELAPWIDAETGAPTPRLVRIQARRADFDFEPERLWVDPWDTRYFEVDHGWMTWEGAALARAARAGDVDAQDTLVALGMRPRSSVTLDPNEWVAAVEAAVAADDVARLWAAAAEAPFVVREAHLLWQPRFATSHDAGRALGRAGLRLLREGEVPAGHSRLEVEGLLELGVERGFGGALLGLVESRAGRTASMDEASKVVLQLSRAALEQELANAPFVEQHLRTWCTDTAGWNTMLRDFGLAVDDSGTPTALLEALREALEHERATRDEPQQDATDFAFFERDRERPRGHAGALLVDLAETQKSPLAARALRERVPTHGLVADAAPRAVGTHEATGTAEIDSRR